MQELRAVILQLSSVFGWTLGSREWFSGGGMGGLGGLRSFDSEEDCNDRSDGIDNRNESVAGIVKKLWFFLKK